MINLRMKLSTCSKSPFKILFCVTTMREENLWLGAVTQRGLFISLEYFHLNFSQAQKCMFKETPQIVNFFAHK